MCGRSSVCAPFTCQPSKYLAPSNIQDVVTGQNDELFIGCSNLAGVPCAYLLDLTVSAVWGVGWGEGV